jgi:hypothetical protein
MVEVRGQDDGRGINGAGQGTPAGFVAAGFQPARFQIRL